MGRNKNRNLILVAALVVVLAVVVFFMNGFFMGEENRPSDSANSTTGGGYVISTPTHSSNVETEEQRTDNVVQESPLPVNGEPIKVHFIDCDAKADSIFVESGGQTMLIDAGMNKNGKKIEQYIKALGYETIDILVGTHPHKDHIGGIDRILEKFEVKNFFMPDVAGDNNEYEDVVNEAGKKSVTIKNPTLGQKMMLGEAEVTFLTPISNEYKEMNDYSIVVRLRFGETSFLLAGDIQRLVERELIDSDFVLSSDVLKIPHHGSDLASSQEFIDAVNPKYGVIFCDEETEIDYPSNNALLRYKVSDVSVFRTDINGTVIFTSDGKDVVVEK